MELGNAGFEEAIAALTKGGKKSCTEAGRNLGRWAHTHAHGFQICDALQEHAPDRVRGPASVGLTIECPHDEEHSNAGDSSDTGCFAVNAGDGSAEMFVISCRHAGCAKYTMLDMLGKMLADAWFARETIDLAEYDAIKREDAAPGTPSPGTVKTWFNNEAELVEAMNGECAIIATSKGARYLQRGPNGEPWFWDKTSAGDWLAPYKLDPKGDGKKAPISGFKVWLESDNRKRYRGCIFNPNPAAVPSDVLNYWEGFAIEEKKGNWKLLRRHIWENVCQKNKGAFRFLMAWTAQLFQQPWIKPGTAIIMRGKEGVGKTMVGDAIREIIGLRHACAPSKGESITGKFNAQLERNIFITGSEVFFAGDKKMAGPLKSLITDPTLRYEPKGIDAYDGHNFSHLMISSNEDWVVPAGPHARRFGVYDVSDAHMQEDAYFDAIMAQMKEGGYAAMLYDLRRYKYSRVSLRKPPVTAALRDQMRRSMAPNVAWLHSVLSEGRFPFRDSGREEVGLTGDIEKSNVFDSYRDFVPGWGNKVALDSDIAKFLFDIIPGIKKTRPHTFPGSSTRLNCYAFPPVADMRAAFVELCPACVFDIEEGEATEGDSSVIPDSTVTDFRESLARIREQGPKRFRSGGRSGAGQ